MFYQRFIAAEIMSERSKADLTFDSPLFCIVPGMCCKRMLAAKCALRCEVSQLCTCQSFDHARPGRIPTPRIVVVIPATRNFTETCCCFLPFLIPGMLVTVRPQSSEPQHLLVDCGKTFEEAVVWISIGQCRNATGFS